jgi:hypothetical protein
MHDSMSTADKSVTCDTKICSFRGGLKYFAAKAAPAAMEEFVGAALAAK